MGSASESFEQERQVNRYLRDRDDFRQRFRDKLRARVGSTTVDMAFEDSRVIVTFPETGCVIRVDLAGPGNRFISNPMPITRAVVRLNESLPGYRGGDENRKGNFGDLKKELRSTKKTEELSLDRVVNQVAETYEEVAPLYQLRRTVKYLIWPTFGLIPAEVETTREVLCQNHKLVVYLKWNTCYVNGAGECGCVGFEVRERNDARYIQDRKLSWEFLLNEPVDVDLFQRQLQEGLAKWDQEDQEKQQRQKQRQSNEAVASRLRKQYQDVDLCSIEANPDNFRLTVWLPTEADTVALLEWLRSRRNDSNQKEAT